MIQFYTEEVLAVVFGGGVQMFENGAYVIYGVHGVCRVIGREKQLINRKRTEYLVLEPVGQEESRYYLPTANETALSKLKPLLTADEMRGLLASDEIREEFWIPDEGARKQYYRDLITSGDRTALLKMVCALYRYRSAQFAAGRKFHQCDENFLRDAEKLLSSEISMVMGLSTEEARDYLREQLK